MSEATDRLKRIEDADEWEKTEHGHIRYGAEKAHYAAYFWALDQLTQEEYFAQDIIARLKQAISALDRDDADVEVVHCNGGIGLDVGDVIHDAIMEIKRLRGEVGE